MAAAKFDAQCGTKEGRGGGGEQIGGGGGGRMTISNPLSSC